jgi:hypothetical protein
MLQRDRWMVRVNWLTKSDERSLPANFAQTSVQQSREAAKPVTPLKIKRRRGRSGMGPIINSNPVDGHALPSTQSVNSPLRSDAAYLVRST